MNCWSHRPRSSRTSHSIDKPLFIRWWPGLFVFTIWSATELKKNILGRAHIWTPPISIPWLRPCKTIMWRWIGLVLTSGREWQCWGMGNLLIVECQINTTMERKSSKLSGAQYRKKEKKKRRKEQKIKECNYVISVWLRYPCHQWRANVVGGITLTLTFVSLLAMMLAMLIQQ